MSRITRAQHQEACEVSDAIGTAAELIRQAAKLLDGVPSRFMPQVEAVPDAAGVDTALAAALSKLSDRIALDADAAAGSAA